jgi:hypothetical protein
MKLFIGYLTEEIKEKILLRYNDVLFRGSDYLSCECCITILEENYTLSDNIYCVFPDCANQLFYDEYDKKYIFSRNNKNDSFYYEHYLNFYNDPTSFFYLVKTYHHLNNFCRLYKKDFFYSLEYANIKIEFDESEYFHTEKRIMVG